jgi:hypothetical protein
MALKKENLRKASFVESYKAQWEQLKNDPRVREKVAHYIRWGQQHVQPYNLWHVLIALTVFQLVMLYCVGFTKTVMVDSLLILLLVIALPDFVTRTPWPIAIRRFPTRARDTLEQQMPILKGRLSERMALVIVLALVAFCVQSLFTTRAAPPPPPPPVASTTVPFPPQAKSVSSSPPVLSKFTSTSKGPSKLVLTPETIEKYYNLGYQDATNEKEKGYSIQDELDRLIKQQQDEEEATATATTTIDMNGPSLGEDGDYDDELYYMNHHQQQQQLPPPPKEKKSILGKLMNFSTMGSVYYIYRLLKEKGTEPTTNLFSIGQLAANLQHHTEPWQQGMLLFSIYNVVRMLF